MMEADMEFVKKFTKARFFRWNFTRKSLKYNKCPIATKQQKILSYNKMFTFGFFNLDNLIRVILPRQAYPGNITWITLPGKNQAR